MASVLFQNFLNDPVFAAFMFYGVLAVAKMTFVQWWTTVIRLTNKTPALPEDYKPKVIENGKEKRGYSDLEGRVDRNVERVRRLHLNDLENIPTFFILSFFYVLTGPSLFVAVWHFRLFVLGRVLHTIAYLLALQPHRSIAYTVAHVSYVSILVQLLFFVLTS
jgi:glutathione S-transferase